MKNLWLKTGLVVASLSVSGLAFAQSSTTSAPAMSGSSTAESSAVAPQKKALPISVSTLSYLHGPFVNDLGSSTVTDDSVGSTTGLDSRHIMALKYKLTDKITIAPTADFNWSFTNAKGDGQNTFTWRDSYIKVSHSDLYSNNLYGNDLSVAGDLRFYVPSSKTARDNDTIGRIRASLNPSIQIGKSRFSISTVNFATVWLQTKDKKADGSPLHRAELYTGPQVNYQVNDAVTAFVLYEADQVIETDGVSNTTNPLASNTDLEPGVDIKINDNITLTPYLNWYTNQRLSTTTVNLAAAITLL